MGVCNSSSGFGPECIVTTSFGSGIKLGCALQWLASEAKVGLCFLFRCFLVLGLIFAHNAARNAVGLVIKMMARKNKMRRAPVICLYSTHNIGNTLMIKAYHMFKACLRIVFFNISMAGWIICGWNHSIS